MLNKTKSTNRMLFLDFDGVICNSLIECIENAYEVYDLIHGTDKKKNIDNVILKKTNQLRPFVIHGEDYYFLPYIMENNLSISTYDEFLELKNSNITADIDLIRSIFYEIRNKNKQNNLYGWLKKNPIYKGIPKSLRNLDKYFDIHIVTTKDEISVHQILEFHQIVIDRKKIHGRENKKSKYEIIDQLILDRGITQGFFVDDNIQNLLSVSIKTVTCFLALWGYVDFFGLKNMSFIPFNTLRLENFVKVLINYNPINLT